jgi:hypothetical protein
VDITCCDCGITTTLDVTPAQVALHQAGAPAQAVFSHLSADERELLISRTCGPCFDSIFA